MGLGSCSRVYQRKPIAPKVIIEMALYSAMFDDHRPYLVLDSFSFGGRVPPLSVVPVVCFCFA
jgi:hypothetical protein